MARRLPVRTAVAVRPTHSGRVVNEGNGTHGPSVKEKLYIKCEDKTILWAVGSRKTD